MNDIAKKSISERLKHARQSEGLSQKLAGDCLGLTQTIVWKMEADPTDPGVKDFHWAAVQKWTNSGMSLRAYCDKYKPTRVTAEHPEGEPRVEEGEEKVLQDAPVTEEADPGKTEEIHAAAPQALQEEKERAFIESMKSDGAIKLMKKEEFYYLVWLQRFGLLKAALKESLAIGDALHPEWVEEYNDLYGKIEEYRP